MSSLFTLRYLNFERNVCIILDFACQLVKERNGTDVNISMFKSYLKIT